LTLPAIDPLTSHFRTSTIKITTGSITSVPPAAIFLHPHPSYCMKWMIATGAVIEALGAASKKTVRSALDPLRAAIRTRVHRQVA
jgi:hypothetical protein